MAKVKDRFYYARRTFLIGIAILGTILNIIYILSGSTEGYGIPNLLLYAYAIIPMIIISILVLLFYPEQP